MDFGAARESEYLATWFFRALGLFSYSPELRPQTQFYRGLTLSDSGQMTESGRTCEGHSVPNIDLSHESVSRRRAETQKTRSVRNVASYFPPDWFFELAPDEA